DKVYRIWSHPRARLTGSLAGTMAGLPGLPGFVRRMARAYSQSVYREFFALRNISFDIYAGETVGIIGRNGSGKSTTLKIIAGTLQPTHGRVSVTGRVAAMLELGSGFEHEFTGRENVFLSAAILGLSRQETEARFDEIAAFADIGDFLDQPTKTYSSGMLVRLAFAVHTTVDPEILIIDEALSVGDETFRRKCFARLDRLKEQGTTILFVSHDLGSVVNLTERALFFHEGEIMMEGSPKTVTAEYQRFCHVSREQSLKILANLKERKAAGEMPDPVEDKPAKQVEAKTVNNEGELDLQAAGQYDPNFKSQSRVDYATNGGEITDLKLYDDDGNPANILQRRTFYTFEYTVRFSESCKDVTFAMLIKTLKGHDLGGGRTLPWDRFLEKVEAGQSYRIKFRFQTLLIPGVYFLNAGVEGLIEGKRAYVHRIMDALVFRVVREKDMMPTGTVDFLIEPSMELLQDSQP
ncbi:MAG TPA: ABC transporter ATP-binding protein, partial [Oceanipulchritudo sp.]|nr:ABC transporter ATP-binding protein [Oceanipulchritudo sp.]